MKECKPPRKISEVYRAWEVIKKAKRPLHAQEIAYRLGLCTSYSDKEMKNLYSKLCIYSSQNMFFKKVKAATYDIVDKNKGPAKITMVYRVLEVLKKSKRAMHINEIMAEVGLKYTADSRDIIGAMIRMYVRKGKYFQKTGRAIFKVLD